ncbi:MAG: ABC transporter permease subunit [Lawsonibacter sp.]|nr:ABC transporter permease subunit [Lawsonibacter sp.]
MGWVKPLKKFLYALPAPAFWLGVWQVCAFLVDRRLEGRGNELLLPYPATVWNALASLIGTGEFWGTVLASLGRIALGLAWGVLLGAALAVLTCASQWADRLLSPAVRVVRAAPVASFILLVLLWAGRERTPAIIAALMVLPVVWDSLSHGIRAMDPKLLELARCYRFSRWKTATLIYLPALWPYILTALTTATGLAWKSGVAAEVLCLPEPSLGQRIYYTKYYLDIPELFAWTAVTVALSMALEQLLRACLAKWGRGWGT